MYQQINDVLSNRMNGVVVLRPLFSDNHLHSRARRRNFCHQYLIISNNLQISVPIRAPASKINQKNGQSL